MKRERIHQLYLILSSSNDWHLADDLALKLHTTTRTIQNYVNEINRSSPDGALITSSFRGYRWEPGIRQKTLKQDSGDRDHPAAPDDRYWYILRRIILEQIDYDQLLDDLFISEATIDDDLQKIRDLARKHGVRLRKVRGRLFLNGRRSDIRRLSYLCVMQNYSRTIVSIPVIKNAFPMYDCDTLYESLGVTLEKYHMTVNSFGHHALFLLIMLQYWDVMHGTVMTGSESVISDIHEHMEYRAASELASVYREKTGAVYNPWEVEYLTAVIISMCEGISGESPVPFTDLKDLKEYTVLNLKNAGRALGINLLDHATVDQTMYYMQRLIIRSKMGLFVRDLTFQSLKISHPVIQDVSAWILIFTAKQYGISIDHNEVGFLTKYLCGLIKDHAYRFDMTINTTLVCPSFGSFPSSLIHSLTTRLGTSVNLYNVIDHYDPGRDGRKENELLLSVIPVLDAPHCVHISLYPRAADFRHIYSELHRIKMKVYSEHLADIMEQYLCSEIIISSRRAVKGDYVLMDICRDLQKSEYIREGFSDDISEREAMDPSVYHSNVALPHVCSENVNRSFIQIALFTRAAEWGNTKINVLCIIGIVKEMSGELHEIYDLCIKVFSNQEIVSAILRSYDRSSFIDTLRCV